MRWAYGSSCCGSCCLLAALALAPAAAIADTYACRLPDGREIRAIYQPPECSEVEIRVLSPSGAVKDVIVPLETAEERCERAITDRAIALQQDADEQQRRYDEALRERYRNRVEIESARQRDIGPILQRLSAAETNLARLEKELDALDIQAEFFQPPHHLPTQLVEAYRTNASITAILEENRRKLHEDLAQVQDRYDLLDMRFAELQAQVREARNRSGHGQSRQP